MPPSAYQLFKTEIFHDIKNKYFTDYELKKGEKIISLVTAKCKQEWEALSEFQKEKYISKSQNLNNETQTEDNSNLPSYEQVIEEKTKPPKKQRKAIPKSVREAVWKKFISEDELKGKCFVGCGNEIKINKFELGHVVAFSNGGSDEIDNLRPICSLCNKSMGTKNLNEFIEQYGFKNTSNFEQEFQDNSKLLKKNKTQHTKLSKELNKFISQKEMIDEKLNSLKLQMTNLKLEIELNEKELTVCEESIINTESSIEVLNSSNKEIELKNIEIQEARENHIRTQLIQEERIKEEIRQELLKEQQREKLKLEVMAEMGF